MKYLLSIILTMTVLAGTLTADDKNPRDDKDKKETSRDKPESKLDKVKDRLKEQGKTKDSDNSGNDDDTDLFDYINLAQILIEYYPENFKYSYAPYPFFEKGLMQHTESFNRPVYLETGISTFTGFNKISATSISTKLKLYTFAGFEYDYCGLKQKTRYFDSELKIHRFGPVLNIITHTYGLVELKFGYTKIIDIGGGPMFGFEGTLAPVYPLVFHGNMQFSSINNNSVNDYFFGIGCALKPIEVFAGYRFFSFACENINGPTGGVVFRF